MVFIKISAGEAGFPAVLASISSPVEAIYVQGKLPPEPRVAIVGARRCDAYGLEMAGRLAVGLARAGVAVVSGGADGVDTAALEGCLETGGKTVAVLGTGVDVAYPAANRGLFARVARAGALLSEYPPGTPGRPTHFPRRNRIISALSDGVVVVRAASRSGSLITARHAARQGRRVMAVPGPAGEELSAGVHQLIRQGAALVESPDEVLKVLGLGTSGQTQLDLHPPARPVEPVDLEEMEPDERRVFEVLSADGSPIDLLVERTGLAVERISGLLLQMELKGLVVQRPGMKYTRSP